jgi:hypothetical protein
VWLFLCFARQVAIPLPRLTPRSFELTSAHIPEIEPLRNLILEVRFDDIQLSSLFLEYNFFFLNFSQSPTNAQSTGLMKQLFPHHKKVCYNSLIDILVLLIQVCGCTADWQLEFHWRPCFGRSHRGA